MVPYDVLVDPLSLPSHPVIHERENILDILYAEPGGSSAMNDSDREQVIFVTGHVILGLRSKADVVVVYNVQDMIFTVTDEQCMRDLTNF